MCAQKQPDMRSRADLHLDDVADAGFMALVAVLMRYRNTIALITISSVVIFTIVCLVLPSSYRAQSVFLPSAHIAQESMSGGIGALQQAARQFGVDIGGEASTDRSYLFPLIIESRPFLTNLLSSTPPLDGGHTLLEHLDVSTDESRKTVAKGVDKLRDDVIKLVFDARSGASTLHVTTHDPELSAWLANLMTSKLDSLLVTMRTEFAGEKAAFVSTRVMEVGENLEAAERDLKSFREHNRHTAGSPDLMLQEGRLIRDVELNQTLFIELMAQHELAKIDKVRTLPDVILIETAIPPVKRFSPRLSRWILMGALIGFGLALGWAFLRDLRTIQSSGTTRGEAASHARQA